MGMRSAEPSIERALLLLKNWGAERVVLLPLFPQFSTTTTGTCFHEGRDALQRLDWQPVVNEIADWADHPGYTKLLRRSVDAAVRKASSGAAGSDEPVHIVFSAHFTTVEDRQAGRSVSARH